MVVDAMKKYGGLTNDDIASNILQGERIGLIV
jgi:hypothetical protein